MLGGGGQLLPRGLRSFNFDVLELIQLHYVFDSSAFTIDVQATFEQRYRNILVSGGSPTGF